MLLAPLLPGDLVFRCRNLLIGVYDIEEGKVVSARMSKLASQVYYRFSLFGIINVEFRGRGEGRNNGKDFGSAAVIF